MIETKKILWIEEETFSMMANYRAYLDASLDYDLLVIDNLEDALALLNELNIFHKIILDIRIYENRIKPFEPQNKYGLKFLKVVSDSKKSLFSKVVILTNEHITELDLDSLGFPRGHYFTKGEIRSTIMLEQKILN